MPLIYCQINLIKFVESNKFDNVYSKIWNIFVWSFFLKIECALIYKNSLRKNIQYRYFPLHFEQFFKKPYLLNTCRWLFLMIPLLQPMFHLLITLFPFFPAFFPFIIDNCNYWSLSREGIKWRFLFYFLQQFIKNQHECC